MIHPDLRPEAVHPYYVVVTEHARGYGSSVIAAVGFDTMAGAARARDQSVRDEANRATHDLYRTVEISTDNVYARNIA